MVNEVGNVANCRHDYQPTDRTLKGVTYCDDNRDGRRAMDLCEDLFFAVMNNFHLVMAPVLTQYSMSRFTTLFVLYQAVSVKNRGWPKPLNTDLLTLERYFDSRNPRMIAMRKSMTARAPKHKYHNH